MRHVNAPAAVTFSSAERSLLHDEAVLQLNRAIEDGFAGLAVFRVGKEVSHAFELIMAAGFGFEDGGLDLGGDGLEGGGIQELGEVALFSGLLIGLLDGEELVIEAQFDIGGMGGADPVDGALDLRAADGLGAVAGGVVVGAAEFGDVSGGVFDDLLADDAEGVLEPHFTAGDEAVEALDGSFHEVFGVDEDLAAERDLALAVGFVLGVVGDFELLALAFGVVREDNLDGLQHGIDAEGSFV
jgi:hypothetical protein